MAVAGPHRHFVIAVLATAITLSSVPLVIAATKKPNPAPKTPKAMSVEEARKVASAKKTYNKPPRTIDDIAKVLEQNKPDPAKIEQLRKTADAPVPVNLSGMARADFLMARGLAARDLGRTQQRVTDLREAYAIAKPLVMKRSPIYVVDFPTQGNPNGSAAFQAWINAKIAAKRAATQNQGGPGGPGAGVTTGRREDPRIVGPRPGGPGPGPGAKTNLERMPKSPQEAKARFNERIPDEQQRAVRMWQNYIAAEADAGNFKNATAIYEEGRASVVTVMTTAALNMDVRAVSVRLRAGDIEGARRIMARLQQLVAIARQHPFMSAQFNLQSALVEDGQGQIALATGKLADAEVRFRNAMRFYEASQKDVSLWPQPPTRGFLETQVNISRLLMAQAQFKQGKLIEAEVETRRALVDFLRVSGVDGPKTAHTVLIFADILQAQGRYKDAQRLAEIALDIYERGGVEKAVHADAMQRIAVAQASRGRWKDAMATFDRLQAAVAHDEVARRRYVDSNLDLAVALTRSGQAKRAIPIFESALKRRIAEGGDNEYGVAEATGFLAVSQAATGRSEEALQNFRSAMPVLLAAADPSAKEDGAVDDHNRRQMIVDGYFDLLIKIKGTEIEKKAGFDAVDEAFRMADIAHAKSVHSAIAASSARAASGDSALADMIRQTQDIDQQIASLSDMLRATLDIPRHQQEAGTIEALRRDIAQVKQARGTLRKEIERKFPQYAELVNPKPVGMADARSRLNDKDVLVVTYFSGARGYVWALRKNASPALAPIGLPEAEIVTLVDTLLRAVNNNANSIDEIPAFDVAAARKLHAALFDPIGDMVKGAESLVVVPHGALGRLPFSLLVTGDVAQPQERPGQVLFAGYRNVPFLIRELAVTHVPSVAAFMNLRSVQAGAPNRKAFLGFGDPWFSAQQAIDAQKEAALAPAMTTRGKAVTVRAAANTAGMMTAELAQLPRLPDTAAEVLEIARALGADEKQDVVLGAKANEEVILKMKLDDRKVVMFATHGLVPGELDGLTQPALALSSPDIPGVGGDGLLTVEKILGLKLDADWVVLSACNTAAGEGSGAEAVSGLGRAFFYAGARALLVTHWPVETVSARALTTDLFRRQAEQPQLSRAGALRAAMVRMIGEGERLDEAGKDPVFSYAHPMFWAPFALVGDGEGSLNP